MADSAKSGKMLAVLVRLSDDGRETLGRLMVFDGLNLLFSCVTLEPPWKNNETGKSCIHPGDYEAAPFESPSHGSCLLLRSTKPREMVEVHVGNYITNTRGCILPGRDFQDINGDGSLDVTFSRSTMANLLSFVQGKIKIKIVAP